MDSSKILTANEKIIMDIFWECNKPLTSVDLVRMSEEYGWSVSYISIVIKSIRKKGLLKEVGIVSVNTRRAYQYVPTKTKEEYAAYLSLSTGIGPDSFSRTALAIAEEFGNKEELIKRLEKLLEELKEQPDD